MPSAKQLSILTFRELTKQCVKEQIQLKMLATTRRAVEADITITRQRLAQIKARVNRELLANAKILGVRDFDDNGPDSPVYT